MLAYSDPSPSPSPFCRSGGASWRLWEALREGHAPNPATTSPLEALDRLPLSLLGRCLTPDGVHVVCEAVAVTPSGLTVACEVGVQPGERIVVNFRSLGEIAGVVDHDDDGWFVLDLTETPERIATLSKRLLWAIRRQAGSEPERRSSERIDQKLRKTLLRSKDGRETAAEMIDLSATGAAVHLGAASPYFWVGQQVLLGVRSGRVRRHFAGGVAIEFDEARPFDDPS